MSAPQKVPSAIGAEPGLPITSSMPRPEARVSTTAMVCGWQSSATKKRLRWWFPAAKHRLIASAAAVPSSRSDALATGIAVSSHTIVCQLRSASRRPCAISAWYGV